MKKFDLTKRHGQLQFISLNLEQLNDCGVAGHRDKGRGMVVVDVESDNEVLAMAEFSFVSLDRLEESSPDFSESREEVMVHDYDPDTDLVICFIGTGNLDSYRISLPYDLCRIHKL